MTSVAVNCCLVILRSELVLARWWRGNTLGSPVCVIVCRLKVLSILTDEQ